jgi:DNA-binding MarR family transcriptional regulator
MSTWLSPTQQQSWRAWLSASMLLTDRLNRDLMAQHKITLADYEILVWLSETPDHRLRMSELAERTLSSRSRLSHQIDRMERAGFVERQECEEDRRGSFAVLTESGFQTLVAAAPGHVDSVRTHLVDALDAQEFAALGQACEKISARLQES